MLDEAARNLHDALCAARDLVMAPAVVPGGGAAELACALAVERAAEARPGAEQLAFLAFSRALCALPEALACNSGLDVCRTLGEARARQVRQGSPRVGVDCLRGCVGDMEAAGVLDSLRVKRMQLLLAKQVSKMVLKVDDIFRTGDPDLLAARD